MDLFTDDVNAKLDPNYQKALDDGIPDLGPFAPLDSSYDAAARVLHTPHASTGGSSRPYYGHSSQAPFRPQLPPWTAPCADSSQISYQEMPSHVNSTASFKSIPEEVSPAHPEFQSSPSRQVPTSQRPQNADQLSAVESLENDFHNLYLNPCSSYDRDSYSLSEPRPSTSACAPTEQWGGETDYSASNPTELDSANEDTEEKRKAKGKGSRRRPRTSRKETGTVWEFCRQLLHSPNTCPSLIRWEDPAAGRFRLVDKDEVARLWGEVKGNQAMNYSKLSRAMRYQYKIKTLKCEKKKLEYSFGENADGWRAERPNFSLLERRASREQLDENTEI
ncbi:ETS-related transcription factor Elf-3-like [Penaeus indicus]|uniref:ETS-related transcription factor Elf-3-like n=1 Tax=Penaeus indicus TaxID=29960 RepID=UPI00300CFBCC